MIPVLHNISNTSVRVVKSSIQMYGHNFESTEQLIVGLDDTIYEKNRDLWETIPRGNGIYTIDGTHVACISGLRKFGYCGSPYGYSDAINTVVFVDKENGECAHIGAFQYNGELYWIAGSKNVHVIFKMGDFMTAESVYTADRYRYAIKIARVWNAQSLRNPSVIEFHKYLTNTGYTACGEAILSDSEHIVSYDIKDIIKFYALTSPGLSSLEGLTAVNPSDTHSKFVEFDLPTAALSRVYLYNSIEYNEACEIVARRINSEGVVAYGIDNNNHVICMWKEKSYPYVMERVVREQIIHDKTHRQIRKRVKQRLEDHDVSLRSYFKQWEADRFPWLLAFAEWLRLKGIVPAENAWNIQSRWLTLQMQFYNAPIEEIKNAEYVRDSHTMDNTEIKVIQFVGLPGCGKSTVARAIYWLLNRAGHNPRWLNQDEAASNRKKYLDAIKTAIADSSTTHIILDKSNLDPLNRKDYTDLGMDISITVNYQHPDGFDAYREVCTSRFMMRGICHRSLRTTETSVQRFAEICSEMYAKYTPPSGNVINVNICEPATSIVSVLSSYLKIIDPDCNSAVQFAQEYENIMSEMPKRPLFCNIKLHNVGDPLLVVAAIPEEALVGKHLRKEFHITTRFLGGEMCPIWFMKHIALIKSDTCPKFTVTEIVWDDRVVVARIKGEFECANSIPHITLALAPKTVPAYSNTLLESLSGEKIHVNIPMTGKYCFD